MNIFTIFRDNEEGVYGVNICWKGIMREVVVDDYFPIKVNDRAALFTSSNDNELWVLILEKVWAKLHGSYW
jgi:calpain-15